MKWGALDADTRVMGICEIVVTETNAPAEPRTITTDPNPNKAARETYIYTVFTFILVNAFPIADTLQTEDERVLSRRKRWIRKFPNSSM